MRKGSCGTPSEKDFIEDRVISEDNVVLFSRATLYRHLDVGIAPCEMERDVETTKGIDLVTTYTHLSFGSRLVSEVLGILDL